MNMVPEKCPDPEKCPEPEECPECPKNSKCDTANTFNLQNAIFSGAFNGTFNIGRSLTINETEMN